MGALEILIHMRLYIFNYSNFYNSSEIFSYISSFHKYLHLLNRSFTTFLCLLYWALLREVHFKTNIQCLQSRNKLGNLEHVYDYGSEGVVRGLEGIHLADRSILTKLE
jgi:hypothetical protein